MIINYCADQKGISPRIIFAVVITTIVLIVCGASTIIAGLILKCLLFQCKKHKGENSTNAPHYDEPIYDEVQKEGPMIEMQSNDAYKTIIHLNK